MEDEQIISGQNEEEDNYNKEELHCRFYRNEWPEEGELVVVEISTVNEDGAYVKLLEYNRVEALILAQNTSIKRIKNVKKLLRVGTQDYMQVTQVDQDGGYLDLTKKNIQVAEIEEKKHFFDKSKTVHLIMKMTAHCLQKRLVDIYDEWGWNLYDKFEHAYDALKLCLTDPEVVFERVTIPEDHKE